MSIFQRIFLSLGFLFLAAFILLFLYDPEFTYLDNIGEIREIHLWYFSAAIVGLVVFIFLFIHSLVAFIFFRDMPDEIDLSRAPLRSFDPEESKINESSDEIGDD